MNIDRIIRKQHAILGRVKTLVEEIEEKMRQKRNVGNKNIKNISSEDLLTIYQEVNKDRRMIEIEGKKSKEKATEKQQKYLRDLGVNPEGISKSTATRIINEKLKEIRKH